MLLANLGAKRNGVRNVRQTSVCRCFLPLAYCRKPRQTEVCRTFLSLPAASRAAALQNCRHLNRLFAFDFNLHMLPLIYRGKSQEGQDEQQEPSYAVITRLRRSRIVDVCRVG